MDVHIYEIYRDIQAELQPGEQLLWADKPAPMRVAIKRLGSAVMGLVLLAFALFWLFMVTNMLDEGFTQVPPGGRHGFINVFTQIFPLFGLVFLFFALRQVLSPVFAYIIAVRTQYGLTNKRALIIKPKIMGKTIESYTKSHISHIERVGDDFGDLIFTRKLANYSHHIDYGRNGQRTENIGFWGIHDLRNVERLMMDYFG